jgi:hypothetical protein
MDLLGYKIRTAFAILSDILVLVNTTFSLFHQDTMPMEVKTPLRIALFLFENVVHGNPSIEPCVRFLTTLKNIEAFIRIDHL